MVSLIEQVSRDITEGRACIRLRCLCLTRPCNVSGFRSPHCHSHCIRMNGVPSRHSFFISSPSHTESIYYDGESVGESPVLACT